MQKTAGWSPDYHSWASILLTVIMLLSALMTQLHFKAQSNPWLDLITHYLIKAIHS